MNPLEQLKTELWALFDRMDKDTSGKGIKTGLVAAQAIVEKHTDGYLLVPVETAKFCALTLSRALNQLNKVKATCNVNELKWIHDIEEHLDELNKAQELGHE